MTRRRSAPGSDGRRTQKLGVSGEVQWGEVWETPAARNAGSAQWCGPWPNWEGVWGGLRMMLPCLVST